MNRRKRAEKLFHQEAGSDYIDRIVEQTASRSLLSFVDRRIRIRACHQNRPGEINDAVFQIARRRFRADLARQRLTPPDSGASFGSRQNRW